MQSRTALLISDGTYWLANLCSQLCREVGYKVAEFPRPASIEVDLQFYDDWAGRIWCDDLVVEADVVRCGFVFCNDLYLTDAASFGDVEHVAALWGFLALCPDVLNFNRRHGFGQRELLPLLSAASPNLVVDKTDGGSQLPLTATTSTDVQTLWGPPHGMGAREFSVMSEVSQWFLLRDARPILLGATGSLGSFSEEVVETVRTASGADFGVVVYSHVQSRIELLHHYRTPPKVLCEGALEHISSVLRDWLRSR